MRLFSFVASAMFSLAMLSFAGVGVAAGQVPSCGCGCATTGVCKCKSCNEHTADPAWKPSAKSDSKDPYRFKSYVEFKDYIAAGNTGYLAVGVKNPFDNSYMPHCDVPSKFCGLADGVYECLLFGGIPSLQPAAPPRAIASPCAGGMCPR